MHQTLITTSLPNCQPNCTMHTAPPHSRRTLLCANSVAFKVIGQHGSNTTLVVEWGGAALPTTEDSKSLHRKLYLECAPGNFFQSLESLENKIVWKNPLPNQNENYLFLVLQNIWLVAKRNNTIYRILLNNCFYIFCFFFLKQ